MADASLHQFSLAAMTAPHSLIALQEVGRSEFIGNVVRHAARLPPRQNVAFNVRAGRKEKLKETAVNVSSFVNFAKFYGESRSYVLRFM